MTIKRPELWYVVPSLGYGGTTRIASALAKYIKTFSVKIVVLTGNPIHKGIDQNIDCFPLVKSVPIWVRGRLLKTIYYFERIRKALHQNVPSIVLGDVTLFNTILLLNHILSRKSLRKSKCLFVRMGNIKSRSLGEEKGVRVIVERLSIKYLFPKATAIITPTEAVKEDLVTNFKVPQELIYVIPNPLDIQMIQELSAEPVDHPWFSDSIPIVTTVGRLSPRKGMGYLIEAIRILRNEGKCRLVIIGDGLKRAELQAKVDKEKLRDYVTFLGEQPNPFKFISRSSLYVHPALWEGFGYAVVEAMACGIPVIAMRDSGGPGEIIDDGIDGLLVPSADPGAIAEAILKLLSDGNLRSRIALQAGEKARRFDAKKVVPIYEKIFWKFLKNKRNSLFTSSN